MVNKNNSSYLQCEKCGGHYELQEGESIDDFESCECGGKLYYTDSVKGEMIKDEPNNLITRYCTSCGYGNDSNATICDNCGAKLGGDSGSGKSEPPKPDKEPPVKEGMSSSTKWLMAIVVILVVVFGVSAGILMMTQGSTTSSDNNQVSVNDSQKQVTNATWHKVTTFSGINDVTRSFTIKGDQFKIVMSAMPTMNYNTNLMKVDISNAKKIGSWALNWGPNSAVRSKNKTVIVKSSSGTYDLGVTTKDLKSWNVTVYDYY